MSKPKTKRLRKKREFLGSYLSFSLGLLADWKIWGSVYRIPVKWESGCWQYIHRWEQNSPSGQETFTEDPLVRALEEFWLTGIVGQENLHRDWKGTAREGGSRQVLR